MSGENAAEASRFPSQETNMTVVMLALIAVLYRIVRVVDERENPEESGRSAHGPKATPSP